MECQGGSQLAAWSGFPGVGPEHSYLKDIGRTEYVGVTDSEALEAFITLSRTEGIIPALESAQSGACWHEGGGADEKG